MCVCVLGGGGGGGLERENSNSKSLILKDSSVRSTWTYHLTASPCYTANTNKHNYTISTNKQLINAVTQCSYKYAEISE